MTFIISTQEYLKVRIWKPLAVWMILSILRPSWALSFACPSSASTALLPSPWSYTYTALSTTTRGSSPTTGCHCSMRGFCRVDNFLRKLEMTVFFAINWGWNIIYNPPPIGVLIVEHKGLILDGSMVKELIGFQYYSIVWPKGSWWCWIVCKPRRHHWALKWHLFSWGSVKFLIQTWLTSEFRRKLGCGCVGRTYTN